MYIWETETFSVYQINYLGICIINRFTQLERYVFDSQA